MEGSEAQAKLEEDWVRLGPRLQFRLTLPAAPLGAMVLGQSAAVALRRIGLGAVVVAGSDEVR